MKDYPKISIITPSFNQVQFIEDTIVSVLNQNYPNLEYIIIDGGSIDGSVNVIKKYENELSYWVSEKDEGQSNAINKGFNIATGDIIAWINSDDTYEPNVFSFVAEFFSSHPEVDFIYGDTKWIDKNGDLLWLKREIKFDYTMGCLIGFGLIITQPASFWRSSVLQKIGTLNEQLTFNMDGEFFFRIATKCNIHHINLIIANFRWYDTSKTASNNRIMSRQYTEEIQMVLRKSYSELKISKYIPFQYSEFLAKIYRIKRITLKAYHKYYHI